MFKKITTHFDDWLISKVSPKTRQWLWFIILWCLGFTFVTALGYGIRTLMGLNA